MMVERRKILKDLIERAEMKYNPIFHVFSKIILVQCLLKQNNRNKICCLSLCITGFILLVLTAGF